MEKQKIKNFKTFYILISLLLLSISGCDSNNFFNNDLSSSNKDFDYLSNEKNQKLNEEDINLSSYFNSNNFKIYRRVDLNIYNCLNGTCPNPDKPMKYFINEDFKNFKNFKLNLNKRTLKITSPTLNWDDMTSRCSEDHYFAYPNRFKIINISKNKIVAIGSGNGVVNRIGNSCSNSYNLKFLTNETWIFTTENISGRILVESPSNFSAPYIDLKNYSEKYSQNKIKEFCNVSNFRVKPWIKLVQYDDYLIGDAKREQNIIKLKRNTLDNKNRTKNYNKSNILDFYRNPESFSFSSSYAGTFLVKPICKIYGKNSEIIKIIESDKLIKIIVKGNRKLDSKWADSNLKKIK